ncbi:MAG: hypothetical protein ACW99A_23745, partial [Candidatus Kariarchaeaceae archaeon]|jgi:hypothetical protein
MVDNQKLPYYLKFYYDREELIESQFVLQPEIYKWNEELQIWDPLPDVISNFNLQYLALELSGDNLLALSQKDQENGDFFDINLLLVTLIAFGVVLSSFIYLRTKRKHGAVKIDYVIPNWYTYNLFLPSIKSIVSVSIVDVAVIISTVLLLEFIIF